MTDTQKAPSPACVTPQRPCVQQARRPYWGNVADRPADLRKHRSAVDAPPGYWQVGGTKAVTMPKHAERRGTPPDGARRRRNRPYGGTR